MTPHQRFRHGDIVESLAVRRDKTTGEHFSQLIDIQETFPDAVRFKVNGVVINFLEDENEQRYEPKRVAHYPDDIIDIVTASPPAYAPLCSPANAQTAQTNFGDPCHPSQLLSNIDVDLAISNLSLQPSPSINPGTLARRPVFPQPSSLTSSNPVIQHQIDRSTDQQSTHHQQLLKQLIQMVEQQNEMVQQQNEMLREQAAAKERDDRMLQELAEAKERDEEMHMMQQQTIDRLIVAQQRIEAILVQNYELHEYPIPRLFVILPHSYKSRDPRNFLMERFRLYFLCECEEGCDTSASHGTFSSHLRITEEISKSLIPVKNRVHLAEHEGYELSRPTEFFDRFGPYVLGMLRILRHCLAVSTVVSQGMALAEDSVRDVMHGVESISKSTMEAVNVSINFLQQKMDDNVVIGDLAGERDGEEDNVFENLAALEGADLRRLDTFLRSNDEDKILGNLYRITTEQGHVKWVCFEHYQERYRATALFSFVQSVETAGGVYDAHLRKVTISLKSSTSAKDFFRRLVKQASAIDQLDVSLDWKFGSSDLVMLVDMVFKSSVKVLKLDLKEVDKVSATIASLRPGRGRYHSLLGLLSSPKLRGLCFSNLLLLGTRTSDLSSSQSPSLLQSFHFLQTIYPEDSSRLANILSHCPGLVDLHLGSHHSYSSLGLPLHRAICTLEKLQVLHLYRLNADRMIDDESLSLSAPEIMKDVVFTGTAFINSYVQKAIRRSMAMLEVLVVQDSYFANRPMDPTSLSSATPELWGGYVVSELATDALFSRLSHLDISFHMTYLSVKFFASVLPRLNLTHFGAGFHAKKLLHHVNFGPLRSLSVMIWEKAALEALVEAVEGEDGSQNCQQLDILRIEYSIGGTEVLLANALSKLSLRELHVVGLSDVALRRVLATVNLSRLHFVSICESDYRWSVEAILSTRSDEFAEDLVVELSSIRAYKENDILLEGAREAQGTATRLAQRRLVSVEHDSECQYLRYMSSVLPKSTF
ncbi:hypothetical protein BGX29_001099 [Mortierella sp. GBA35]|nr:hypothetical protein BGX29_001099 [Mortierella sp. GBA35]